MLLLNDQYLFSASENAIAFEGCLKRLKTHGMKFACLVVKKTENNFDSCPSSSNKELLKMTEKEEFETSMTAFICPKTTGLNPTQIKMRYSINSKNTLE